MIFSSLLFVLVFLPIFLCIYYLVPLQARNVVLLIGSLLFYACGEPRYLFLLCILVFINYWFGRSLNAGHRGVRNLLLTLGISFNLSQLIFFRWAAAEVGLPLGISFFSFQSIAYLIDVHRREIKGERSFLSFGTYMVMFPQLLVGPIVTYKEVEKQIKNPVVMVEDFDQGLKTFTVGLAMKVLLADQLTILWKEIGTIGFGSISVAMAWLGVLAFSLQIYFDFAGYSLMALGLGRMLGYHLPENFRRPYTATSVRDFYRRWHMSLGRWFKTYIYIPMGGNRGTLLQTLFHLFIVWILTSMWHGFTLNYFCWGMFLFVLIGIEKIVDRKKEKREIFLKRVLKHGYVWLMIGISWICFAVTDIGQLGTYLGRMFGIIPGVLVNHTIFPQACMKYGGLLILGVLLCTETAYQCYQKIKDNWLGLLILTVLFWLSVQHLIVSGNNPFLYYRF